MAKQHINLFDESMLHGNRWREWRGGVAALLILICAEFVYINILGNVETEMNSQHRFLQQQSVNVEEQIDRVKNSTVELTQEVDKIKQRISGLNNRKSQLEETVKVMAAKSIFSRSGFSPLLESLALTVEEDTYLTSFNIVNGGQQLYLTGHSMGAAQPSGYIHRLANSKVSPNRWTENR